MYYYLYIKLFCNCIFYSILCIDLCISVWIFMFFFNVNDESFMYVMFLVIFKLKLLFLGFLINVIVLLLVFV